MASAIICLADNHKFNFSKYIFDHMVKSLEGGIKFYMFPRFLQIFLDNQVKGMERKKEMYVISSHTKKIFANMRRTRADFSRVVTPLFETMMVQAAADMGNTPVKTHPIPIVDQPSTFRPQKKQKPRRKQRKEAEVSPDESEDEDHVPTPSSDPLPSGEDSYTLYELMVFCTSLQEQMFDLQEAKDAQSKEIAALKKKVSKLLKWRKSRSRGLGRLMKIGSGRRVKSPLEKDSLDADTQGWKTNDEMFGVDDLTGEEVVTTAADKVSVALTIDVTKDEITMAQALAALKSIKPTIPTAATKVRTAVPTPRAKGIVFQEQKQSHIPTVFSSKDNGKAKMIEPEVPIKKKDHIRMDEEYARQVEAEEREAARLSVAQQDEEANISWDNTQAIMKADSLLAKRLQAREREEFSEGRSYDEIKKLFDREMKKVNHFIDMDSKAQMSSRKEAQESSTKRIVESLESDISKKQKVDENVDLIIDDTEELKKCMEIVLDYGDEVLIEATPISSRSPTIVDYKIHKKGKNNYFKIIRADGNSQSIIYYLLVEKVYPLTRNTLHQLWNDVRL
uniref:Synaptobrevin, longin-like domain protein n=1 Tax=Tanacetum cinerariifolium TaxID=118510 RepID=A0A699HC90_TANCI|nr:hypothetical protein [Tanacetum cinerariifolium]